MTTARAVTIMAVLLLGAVVCGAQAGQAERATLESAFSEGRFREYLTQVAKWYRSLPRGERSQHPNELVRSAMAIHELGAHEQAQDWADRICGEGKEAAGLRAMVEILSGDFEHRVGPCTSRGASGAQGKGVHSSSGALRDGTEAGNEHETNDHLLHGAPTPCDGGYGCC